MPGTVQAAWPEGVLARYLTKASEITGDLSMTVDVSEKEAEDPEDEGYLAACRGCNASTLYNLDLTVFALKREHVSAADGERLAREWAQSHAETCRAMTRPTA
ncbi:hypothetical protein [Streptomyces lavendulocolor]|uniref:hypothetical protein n=1 Tax=Streptomyces lavendulocolor TaxID=67316 RepID=UPI0033C5178E